MLQYSKPNGKMRLLQGYSPGRLVHDCEPLQMTWLRDLQKNLNALDLSLLLRMSRPSPMRWIRS
ncbi:MAG: hypothetical protein DMG76_19805 [Acidobacteria bacterium]|nr:MAG: hypothetical protein DMG76_19805 [Acidobacteriota bacterium]